MTAVAPVLPGPAAAIPAVQLLPWKKEALLETWWVGWCFSRHFCGELLILLEIWWNSYIPIEISKISTMSIGIFLCYIPVENFIQNYGATWSNKRIELDPGFPRNQSFPLTPEYGGRFHCWNGTCWILILDIIWILYGYYMDIIWILYGYG